MRGSRNNQAGISDRFTRKNVYVHPEIRKAETLPPQAFTEPEFLDLELRTIFTKTWLLVPQRSSQGMERNPRSLSELVRLRGAQAPFTLLDKPLFFQRDWKGNLHCFPNVCTHAWYPLVHGPSRERAIICGQHGRQFNTEGRFLSQTGFHDMEEDTLAKSFHLKEFAVQQWLHFLFVNLGKSVAAFTEFLQDMQQSAKKMIAHSLKPIPHASESREVSGNWKQHAWNYMDKFHIGYIHRAPGGLADAIDLPTYQTELHRFSALQWVYARNPDHGFDHSLLPSRFRDRKSPGKRVFALWWFIFPNMTFNFYPWGLSVNMYMPIPAKPEHTQFLWYHYILNEEKYDKRNEIWLNQQVDEEDIDAMMQVRTGIRSGFAPRGRFAAEQETGPHWFHRLVYKMAFET